MQWRGTLYFLTDQIISIPNKKTNCSFAVISVVKMFIRNLNNFKGRGNRFKFVRHVSTMKEVQTWEQRCPFSENYYEASTVKSVVKVRLLDTWVKSRWPQHGKKLSSFGGGGRSEVHTYSLRSTRSRTNEELFPHSGRTKNGTRAKKNRPSRGWWGDFFDLAPIFPPPKARNSSLVRERLLGRLFSQFPLWLRDNQFSDIETY